ncbi:MAG: hypothetical protein CMK89_07760 [Pseudomonadales bacterium]|nr:hypothetical protein [Pseudomonadales bacterium]
MRNPIRDINDDAWRKLGKTYWIPFLLVVMVFSFYAHSVRQRITLEPLTTEEAESYSEKIMNSKKLQQTFGAIQEVEFLGGIFEQQRDRYTYSVYIITQDRKIQAELRLTKVGADVKSAHLVHVSLGSGESFSIDLKN